MAHASRALPAAGPTTGLLVVKSTAKPVLCPFFEKCDGILLFDHAQRAGRYCPYDRSHDASVCDLVLRVRPQRLVCGFISPACAVKLRKAGIDVRLGSCATPVEALVACFCELPEA